ncbi:MAG: methyltransferase [Longimicrobiales bacterium]
MASERAESRATATRLAGRASMLRAADPGLFRRLKVVLTEVGFTEAGICERIGVKSMSTFAHRRELPLTDALAACILLFLHDEPVPQSFFSSVMPADAPGLMQELGLLQWDAVLPDHWRAPLSLYPIHGLYLVSDQLLQVIEWNGRKAPDDVVYPALSGPTAEFIEGFPLTPCDALLDIGTGTGIAALVAAANGARQIWAVDITERSSHMCEYNARLNGIDSVIVRTGDLYDPVAGLTFDRIVAHPPYMPEPESHMIFRDGGSDGEQITRRIITGLPHYLRPGGRFYCRCLATDRAGGDFEQRIRALLGPAHDEFDVVVISALTMPPGEYYGMQAVRGELPFDALERHLQSFGEIEAKNLIISFVHIERHTQPQPPLTVRRKIGSGFSPRTAVIDWLLAWERAQRTTGFSEMVLQARPTVTQHATIELAHRMTEGRLRALAGRAHTQYPFLFSMESSPGLVLMLGACDGSRTVTQLHHEMRELGVIPANTPTDEFLEFIRHLTSGAVLEFEGFKIPERVTSDA